MHDVNTVKPEETQTRKDSRERNYRVKREQRNGLRKGQANYSVVVLGMGDGLDDNASKDEEKERRRKHWPERRTSRTPGVGDHKVYH